MSRPDRSKSTTEDTVFAGRIWRGTGFERSEFSISEGKISPPGNGPRIASGTIIPPFADPHLHGGWGLSFREGDFKALEDRLCALGVMFAVPTLENLPPADLRRTADRFKAHRSAHPESIFPFLRVEGPFISSAKRGFQREEHILSATRENIEAFLSIEEIGLFTFAPEIEGASDLVRAGFEVGRIPSVGHSRSGFADFHRVYQLGVRHMTHFPNAMSGLHHREIGLLGAGLLLDDLQLEIIADGIHNAPEFVSLVLKMKGPEVALTSDMIPPAFSGRHDFDGRDIQQSNGRMTMETGVLAGGATPVPDQVVRLHRMGHSPEDLVRMACLNARRWLGRTAPELTVGAPADFCCLDEDMTVTAVYRGGRLLPGVTE